MHSSPLRIVEILSWASRLPFAPRTWSTTDDNHFTKPQFPILALLAVASAEPRGHRAARDVVERAFGAFAQK